MDNILLYCKVISLPENLKSEVDKFIDSLLSKEKMLKKNTAKFGSAKGMFVMRDNFDDRIEDFKDY